MTGESLTIFKAAAFLKISLTIVLVIACSLIACSPSRSNQQNILPTPIKESNKNVHQQAETEGHTKKLLIKSTSTLPESDRDGLITEATMDWI